MKRFNLSGAATAILEGSKETFDANIASKRGSRGQGGNKGGVVGDDKLSATVAYGAKEAGVIGDSPTKNDDDLPDYLKGTPSATPPGATPPVGSEKNGVGYTSPKNQPQQTQGRADLRKVTQTEPTHMDQIRDRIAGTMPKQTFAKNTGATFQSYGESVDMSADVLALLDGENLSEEFAQKATTIFEAAVISRIETIAEQIEQELVEQFEAAVEQVKEELSDRVDDYLNYMAEQWMTENALAIETGLRSEITEEFISGLRNLFVEHYIDIPEDKVDVVSEMAEKVSELEDQLNEQINRGIELRKELNEQKKIEAIYTACEGLTQTQSEKLKSLAESVDFNSDSEFVSKLSTLKESYFKVDIKFADKTALDEVLVEEERKTFKSTDPLMEQYATTISKSVVK